MAELTITIKGEAPLVVHNVRLADPLDDYSRRMKTITGKRKKTDEDHEQLKRIEFEGSSYHDDDIGPYVPTEMLFACLKEGAKLTKRGREVERAIVLTDPLLPLIYEGPRDIEALYEKGWYYRKAVGVGQARTMRTRPMFEGWTLQAHLLVDTARLNVEDVESIARDAGAYAGIGERRPMFGRFTPIIEEGWANGGGRRKK